MLANTLNKNDITWHDGLCSHITDLYKHRSESLLWKQDRVQNAQDQHHFQDHPSETLRRLHSVFITSTLSPLMQWITRLELKLWGIMLF